MRPVESVGTKKKSIGFPVAEFASGFHFHRTPTTGRMPIFSANAGTASLLAAGPNGVIIIRFRLPLTFKSDLTCKV
jgi:hypothetical protein